MSIRLLVNPQVPFGQMVLELADKLAESQATMARVKMACDSMTYGNPTDYASMEQELGLSAGKGPDFYSLISQAKDALFDPIITEFINRTDQG